MELYAEEDPRALCCVFAERFAGSSGSVQVWRKQLLAEQKMPMRQHGSHGSTGMKPKCSNEASESLQFASRIARSNYAHVASQAHVETPGEKLVW